MFLGLLFFVMCKITLARSCPGGCSCLGNDVHCDSRGLREFPVNVPLNTQQLLLENNAIGKVPRGALGQNCKIHIILLNSNHIELLTPGVFQAWKALSYLDLGSNFIQRIPNGVLSDLKTLRLLNLTNNKLSTLSPGAFVGLTSLRELYLSHNELTSLPVRLFITLRNLTSLKLDNNNLIRIQDRTFFSLSSLQQLDLSHNRLRRITSGTTVGLARLQRLALRGNRIEKLDPQFAPPAQACSRLSTNSFERRKRLPSRGSLSHLEELRVLDIRNNSLTTLRYLSFSSLTKLNEVLLEQNKWKCDCYLKWSLERIRSQHVHKVLPMTRLRCWKPLSLRGAPISDLSVQDLSYLPAQPVPSPSPTQLPPNRSQFNSVTLLEHENDPSLVRTTSVQLDNSRVRDDAMVLTKEQRRMSAYRRNTTRVRPKHTAPTSKKHFDNLATAPSTRRAGSSEQSRLPRVQPVRSLPPTRLPDRAPGARPVGNNSPAEDTKKNMTTLAARQLGVVIAKHDTLVDGPRAPKSPKSNRSAENERRFKKEDQQPSTSSLNLPNNNDMDSKSSSPQDEVISWLMVAAIFSCVFAIAICGAVALNRKFYGNESRCGCCRPAEEAPKQCTSESIRSFSNYPLLYDNPLARRPLPRQPMPTSREHRPGGPARAGSGLDIRWTCGGTFGIGETTPSIPPRHPSRAPGRFVSRLSSSCSAPVVPPRDPVVDKSWNDVTDDATDSMCSDRTSVSAGGGSFRSMQYRHQRRDTSKQFAEKQPSFQRYGRGKKMSESPKGRTHTKRQQQHRQRHDQTDRHLRPGSAFIDIRRRDNANQQKSIRQKRTKQSCVSAPVSRHGSDVSNGSYRAARRAKRERDMRHALEVLQEIEIARRNSNAAEERRKAFRERTGRSADEGRTSPDISVHEYVRRNLGENFLLGSVATRKSRKSASARRCGERPVGPHQRRDARDGSHERRDQDSTRDGAARSQSLVVKHYVGDMDFAFPPPPTSALLTCSEDSQADTLSLSDASFEMTLTSPTDHEKELETPPAFEDEAESEWQEKGDAEDDYSHLALCSSGSVANVVPTRQRLEERLRTTADNKSRDKFPRGRNDSTDSMFASRHSNCDSLSASDCDGSNGDVTSPETELTLRCEGTGVRYRSRDRLAASPRPAIEGHRTSAPVLPPAHQSALRKMSEESERVFSESDDNLNNNAAKRYLSNPGDPYSVNINRRSRLDLSLSDSEWENSITRQKAPKSPTRPSRSSSGASSQTITPLEHAETGKRETPMMQRATGKVDKMRGASVSSQGSESVSSIEYGTPAAAGDDTYQALHHMYSGRMLTAADTKRTFVPPRIHISACETGSGGLNVRKSELKRYYVDTVESSTDDVSTDIEMLDLGTM